jgi:hypothetical protein
MPYRTHLAIFFAATLGLAACTTLTAAERTAACRATDWASYGLNDGILGVSAVQRDRKFADCADLGVPADLDAYRAGREEGLAIYCTLENGYDVGYAGRRYSNVCPPELEAAFLQGYEQGRKERPVSYYPYYGYPYYGYPYYGYGFGYYGYPYFDYRYGHRHHR